MNNIFHVCSEKKTTKPAKKQCYRLVINTEQNRKIVFYFEDIFDDFLSKKIRKRIQRNRVIL